ncbi:MAG: hypothetical protein FWD15_04730 [Alphaproteobacteria bacterium]|nr:hypothetical protein [Alphaproteobacteria bacterium]
MNNCPKPLCPKPFAGCPKPGTFAAALLAISLLAGCSGSGDKATRLHQDEHITRLSAKMRQVGDKQETVGTVRFDEGDAGLKMYVDIEDVKPNTTFALRLYDISSCEFDKRDRKRLNKADKMTQLEACKKIVDNVRFPMLKSDEDGNIETEFLLKGTSATKINGMRIALCNTDKEELCTIGGKLRSRRFF